MDADAQGGIGACAAGDVTSAAMFALQHSRYWMLTKGYDGRAPDVVKAVYYASMADIFDVSAAVGTGEENTCLPLAPSVRGLAVRYLQDAYDRDERLHAAARESERPAILALMIRVANKTIPPNAAAALREQALAD